MSSPKLIWDLGTCYDFYMSLWVLHNPEKSGLRGKWAAGVRSRLPAAKRDILHQASKFLVNKTLPWLYRLPAPKDGQTILKALTDLPAEERIPTLFYSPELPLQMKDILEKVAARQTWTEADRRALPPVRGPLGDYRLPKETQIYLLEWCAHRAEYGERYVQALQMFYEVFRSENSQLTFVLWSGIL